MYDIQFWEARRIIRGYRKRDKLKHQLIAECVYAATYAMRDSKGKTVANMFPSLFKDDDDYQDEPPLTDDERAELIEDMKAWNAQLAQQGETQP